MPGLCSARRQVHGSLRRGEYEMTSPHNIVHNVRRTISLLRSCLPEHVPSHYRPSETLINSFIGLFFMFSYIIIISYMLYIVYYSAICNVSNPLYDPLYPSLRPSLPYPTFLSHFLLSPPSPRIQSSIAVYDLESGQKRFEVEVDGGERTVVLVRHLISLRDTHVACSTGRDIQLLPCNVKLKVD